MIDGRRQRKKQPDVHDKKKKILQPRLKIDKLKLILHLGLHPFLYFMTYQKDTSPLFAYIIFKLSNPPASPDRMPIFMNAMPSPDILNHDSPPPSLGGKYYVLDYSNLTSLRISGHPHRF